MRRFPKTPTSDSNRLTSPTLLPSNVSTNASAISGSANNNTSTSFNTNGTNGSSTHTFSWSSVAAANSNNNTTSRSLHNEASEKSDVPGADSALNPFKYSKEFMLKLYKPVGLPLEFERHEYVTSEEPLQPMALIMLTEQEHKLLSGASVNSELTRRIVSNATGGVVTGNERVVERERVPFSPRGDKHIGTGLTSPRTERFVGITGGVLSERTSPRSNRPPRVSGTLNTSSVDDPVWNGVTRHAIGTFDSNGVFRIPGSNVDDESIDKSRKDDSERNKKIEQELEKKSQISLSDTGTYNQSAQDERLSPKKEQTEFQDESVNEIEESLKTISIKESQSSSQDNLKFKLDYHNTISEQQEQDDRNGWQESPGKEILQDENSEQKNVQEKFNQQEQDEQSLSLRHNEAEKQQKSQDVRNLILEEEEREKDRERENERDRERDQQLIEQQVIMQQLQLQQEKEKELQQRHEKQKMQRQFQEQEQLQIHMQQRQEQEQKQLQLQLQLQLQHQQQQQQLLLQQQQQQQQQILQDQQDLLQRQQQILQQQHQQLLLPHHFDPDQDDDVLKEAFSYSSVVGNSPPMSPGKSNKYSNTHSIIGTTSAFSDTTGASSLFSSGGITPDSRKITSEQKWLYRDPSGNIQGPFSSQEMNDWYKNGFFALSLLVKRVEDTTFEPLGVLIRKTGDDERPFSAPLMGSRPSLTISMPNNSSRIVNDPFPRTWATPTSPSTAQLFLEHQQRFNPFGGTASVPSTPFDRYQFGGVFGRNDVTNGWNDLGTTNNAWGSTSNAGNLSPRLPVPNSPPPLFNGTASFNVSPPQTYLEHQRALTSQIERQQFLMLQQRQIQQNQHTYPENFLRQQHQNFTGMPGPVSAPITNAPNSPFTDVLSRSSGWTTTTEQPPPSSPWGIVAPGIGVTPSRVSQSEDIGYFGLRKENNLGLQSRTGERPYDIMGGQIHETSFDNKTLDNVSESITKPVLGDEEAYGKKVEENVTNQEKTDTTQISKPPLQLTQKEELNRSKSSLREIQVEEERKKQYGEKEKPSVVSSTSNTVGKLSQYQKPNLNWGGNSPVTPSSPAPWAKDEDHSVQKNISLREIQEIEAKQAAERQGIERQVPERKSTTVSTINATLAPWAKDEDHSAQKTPSLREIQEMEAKQAAERQASERKVASTSTTNANSNKEDPIPSSISWGIVVPTPSNESNSSSLSTSPVVATPAWQANNTAPKKTLREIQKEEEEATKRRNKIREMQQAALNNANVSSSSTTTQSNVGKRYADTVSIVPPKKTPTNNVSNAWTTVASKTVTRATTNSSAATNGTSSVTMKSSIASKDSSTVWDTDHKNINNLQGSSRVQNQSVKPGETLKNGARAVGVNLGTSKNATTNSNVKSNNQSSGSAAPSSDYSTPKPPSEEFLKWCKQALRGLNNVNVEEFMQMLLSFPLDPPPATVEIIQDSIYANSPTLDGRRFADEFIKRRKADANGLPMNSLLSHMDNKASKDSTAGNISSKEDYAGNGAGAFKVVTAKKGKKKQAN
ncbi:18892_t:CDS:2 [Acaulospora morrowiae]|uniref:18892_t:CDS:1 n=1 Tax=Acaulospora morrowiae TaxID=94023 RepID=A0A9N9AJU7_9GLOM|nr:18892_t:CDS:2 [Acaulospora morrowiae]